MRLALLLVLLLVLRRGLRNHGTRNLGLVDGCQVTLVPLVRMRVQSRRRAVAVLGVRIAFVNDVPVLWKLLPLEKRLGSDADGCHVSGACVREVLVIVCFRF